MGSSSGFACRWARGARAASRRAGSVLAERTRGIGPGRGRSGEAPGVPCSSSSARLGHGRLLQDQVGVGAADRRRRRPRRGGGGRWAPRAPASVSSSTCPALPVDLGGGRIDVKRLRQDALAHRHHHLDHPGHPCRCLGVADVGLDRAEAAAAARAPGRRWRAGRRPRSGPRAWCRCRGPRPRRRLGARGGRWRGPGGSPAPGRGRWGR